MFKPVAFRRWALFLTGVVACWLWTSCLQAAPSFPKLTGRVVDTANLLPGALQQKLTQQLRAYEDKTSNQVVVVTVKSLQGYDIADYGYQLGRHWEIGKAGQDNGVLFIIAPNDRKVRIEVGYGLEGTLTDALSKRIIDGEVIPRFKQKDYAGGIEAGTNAILGVLGGRYDVSAIKKRPQAKSENYDQFFTVIIITIVIGEILALFLGTLASSSVVFASSLGIGTWLGGTIGIGFILAFIATLFHLFNRLSGRGGRGGFGGGFGGGGYSSGGGFGGFSGGGGSFGGGGASGGW